MLQWISIYFHSFQTLPFNIKTNVLASGSFIKLFNRLDLKWLAFPHKDKCRHVAFQNINLTVTPAVHYGKRWFSTDFAALCFSSNCLENDSSHRYRRHLTRQTVNNPFHHLKQSRGSARSFSEPWQLLNVQSLLIAKPQNIEKERCIRETLPHRRSQTTQWRSSTDWNTWAVIRRKKISE